MLLRDGGAAQARELEGRHEAARQAGSAEESQRLFAAALAAALPGLGPLHRLRHASADGVLLNGGSETRGGAAATSMMAAAKQLLAFHQARDDLCAPARTELPTAAVAPLLQLGKAAQLLGVFEPEGRAAVQRAAAILRPFPCDVSGLERWLRAPVDDDAGRR